MLIKKRVKYKNWTVPSLGGEGWTDIDIEGCKEFSLAEIEIHELWFEFLKRSDYSQWNRKLKQEFDNVSLCSKTAYKDMQFPEWWTGHNLHFSVAALDGFIEIENKEDYRDFKQMADDPAENVMIFALFMDTPVNVAKRQLAEILKAQRKKTSRYTSRRRDSNGYYPLYGYKTARYLPDAEMLWKTLDVYDTKIKYANAGIRRFGWQIEEEISERRIAEGRNPLISRADRLRKEPMIGKKQEFQVVKYKWDDFDDDERRKVQAATISRYFAQAKTIIANVEKGVFPKSDNLIE